MLRKIKIMGALLCCLMTLSFSNAVVFAATPDEAAAENKPIYVKELDMSITLPKNMSAVTRQSSQNDSYFIVLSEQYNDVMSYMQDSDCYLVGKTYDRRMSLAVTMTKDENSVAVDDYAKLKNRELEKIRESYMKSGMYSESQTLKYNGATFLEFLMNYKNGDTPVCGICCNTVVNGMIVNLTFVTAGGVPTAEENTLIHSIMETVSFGNGPAFWDAQKIIIVSCVALALIAVAVVIIVAVKKYKSPQKKHERIMSRLNREYGYDGSENDYDEYSDIALTEPDGEERLVRDYPFEMQKNEEESQADEADSDSTEQEYEAEDETDEILQEVAARQEASDGEKDEGFSDKRTTGVFAKLTHKPEHLTKEEDIFESGEDYFEEIYDDEIDGKETVDSFYEEIEEKEHKFEKLRGILVTVKDSALFALAAVCAGVKYFFVHMGYLCINISRAVKRSMRKNKAKKRQTKGRRK